MTRDYHLLYRLLTPKQRRLWKQYHAFPVIGRTGNRYIIWQGQPYHIYQYQGIPINRWGFPSRYLTSRRDRWVGYHIWVQLSSQITKVDQLIAKKLALETDDFAYLHVACSHLATALFPLDRRWYRNP